MIRRPPSSTLFPTRRSSDLMVIDPVDPDTRSVGSFFMNPIVSRPDREHVSAAAGIMVPGFETPDGRVKLPAAWLIRSEEHTSELQSQSNLVCRLLLEKKKDI